MRSANKLDQGKPMLQLVDPHFIEGVGKVLTMGATKYGRDNWKSSVGTDDHKEFVERVKGAALRHLMEYMKGVHEDDESGLSHLSHVACNLMFLEHYDRQLREGDTQSPKDGTIGGTGWVHTAGDRGLSRLLGPASGPRYPD